MKKKTKFLLPHSKKKLTREKTQSEKMSSFLGGIDMIAKSETAFLADRPFAVAATCNNSFTCGGR